MIRKKIIIFFVCLSLTSCGVSKPSWERKDRTVVTQNDHAFMGILFSALVLFSLHTFTNAR